MFDAAEIGKASFAACADAERLALLNRQIAYARSRSPYYRNTLPAAPLERLADLSALPFTDVETIRREGRRLVCVSAGEVARIVSLATSGSTGSAKRLYFTGGDLARTVRFFSEGMAWLCTPGDTCAVLMPCTAPDGIGDLLCRGLAAIGVRPLPIGTPEDFAKAKEILKNEHPQVLVGFPWHLRLLSLTCPELRPRAVLLSGDYAPPGLKALISALWQTTVTEHFGMTETGYGCAVQHPARPELYLRRDELIAEVVDPRTGALLPAGNVGELVLTTLRREAMPLLRCRTGDLAALTPEGNLSGVYGRCAVPAEVCRLQDALAPLPWLWDYRAEAGTLTAFLSPDAPPEAAQIFSAAAPGDRIVLHTLAPEDAAPVSVGKRV